jgi:mRNA interferase RelE/StbE
MNKPRRWQIVFTRQPERIIRRLPRDLLRRIDQKLFDLEADPRPQGCKKLAGASDLYRVRVGDWRITYRIEDDQLIVLVLEIAPRGGAYRNLP